MKLLLSITMFLLMVCGGIVRAERMDYASVRFVNVTTSSTESVQTSDFVYNGYVERISAVFTTNNPIKMKISAYNEYSGLSETIYENTNGVGTNFIVYPRISAHTTAGASMAADKEYIHIPLIKDKIRYEVYSASETNQTVLIMFYYNGI